MPTIFERYADLLHSTVDDGVGDTIMLAIDGVTYVEQTAFIIVAGAGEETIGIGVGGVDFLRYALRLKIRKTKLPHPDEDVRVKCARKMGTQKYALAGDLSDPESTGEYWLLDLMKASF